MKLLYVSYWSLGDALTEATVLPNLKILDQYFSHVYLATIERTSKRRIPLSGGVIHVPYYSATRLPRFAEKASDLIFFTVKLILLAKREKIDVIICRGSMAGIFGVALNRTLGLPFMVESFEPHAEYMAEGNTWRKSGFEYRFQKWIETQSLKEASVLMPVSNQYAKVLKQLGVPRQKLIVMPCCVDTHKFRFNNEARIRMRNELGIGPRTVVGIYIGKFGDLYFDEEAFDLFSCARETFDNNFFLIVLSPHNNDYIRKQLKTANFHTDSYFVASVENTAVPDYLSASDFAFSLARPAPNRRYLSPVKNGEYWANGLPILLSDNQGDDELITIKTGAGAIFELTKTSIQSSLQIIKTMIARERSILACEISAVAIEYRSFDIIEKGYKEIFRSWRSSKAQ